MTFKELKISEPILKALSELGYEEPMPVQEAVIPYLLGEKLDLVALAQTGTGKTAAYALPILECLEDRQKDAQALILTPTRELCIQVTRDFESYAKYLPAVGTIAVYGGSSIETQIRAIKKGVDVIVATPGRLLDLMRRKAVSLSNIQSVILDEADEMLNMGFSEDLKEILSQIPQERRLLLFSATMSKEMAGIAKKYLSSPKEITIGNKNEANTNITHSYCLVPSRQRYLALKRIVDFYPMIYGIVFCRTRMDAKDIAEHLIRDGYNADALHGDLSQEQRDRVMQRFRLGNLQLLVATDVAARGLDVDNLTHVIHYGLPDDVENYTHRSGRTARAGRKGMSIALCHLREKGRIRSIERLIGSNFEEGKIPSGKDICSKQLFSLADKIENLQSEELQKDIEELLPDVCKKLEWLDKEELIRRIMTLEFNRFFEYYRSAEEIDVKNLSEEKSNKREKKKSEKVIRQAEEGMTRLFINFGKHDRLFPNKLIELINRCVPARVGIGKIDLMQKFSFFEVNSEDAQMVVEELSQYEVEGRKIIVDYAESVSEGSGGEKRSKDRSSSSRRRSSRAVPSDRRDRGARKSRREESSFNSRKRRSRK